MTFYEQLSVMLGIVKVWKNWQILVWKPVLPSLANKYCNSLRDENDESIYTYNDEYMRNSVRQSRKCGGCGSFNQYYKSIFSDEVFKIFSKQLDFKGEISKILDKHFQFTNKHRKKTEDE